jgi:hypothetical protein
MADISTTDGCLIRISGEPMSPDDISDEDEKEDVIVTDNDLNQLEDERLLDEGDNGLGDSPGYHIDDTIEKHGEMSQQNAYLTPLHLA